MDRLFSIIDRLRRIIDFCATFFSFCATFQCVYAMFYFYATFLSILATFEGVCATFRTICATYYMVPFLCSIYFAHNKSTANRLIIAILVLFIVHLALLIRVLPHRERLVCGLEHGAWQIYSKYVFSLFSR